MLRRYGSVNVPITSLGVIIYGLVMLVSPASSFQAAAYQEGPFQLAGQRAWAVAFIAAGLAALTFHHLLAIMPLLMVVSGWSIFFIIAAVDVDGVSPTAGIAWAIIATQLLVSVSIRGTAARHQPPTP